MTVHNIRPASHPPADTLPGMSLRTTLAVCRWWFWALRADCSGEWDHTISRLFGGFYGAAVGVVVAFVWWCGRCCWMDKRDGKTF